MVERRSLSEVVAGSDVADSDVADNEVGADSEVVADSDVADSEVADSKVGADSDVADSDACEVVERRSLSNTDGDCPPGCSCQEEARGTAELEKVLL